MLNISIMATQRHT